MEICTPNDLTIVLVLVIEPKEEGKRSRLSFIGYNSVPDQFMTVLHHQDEGKEVLRGGVYYNQHSVLHFIFAHT